jgi:nitrite reductase (NADH) large subunit
MWSNIRRAYGSPGRRDGRFAAAPQNRSAWCESSYPESTTEIVADEQGRVCKMTFADGEEIVTDMIVFSAGIRPAMTWPPVRTGSRRARRHHYRRRVPHQRPDIYAIGECALYGGRIFGLVAPGYQMATTLVDVLNGGSERFTGADMSTKLKLMGVDVAAFGDGFGRTPGAQEVVFLEPAPAFIRSWYSMRKAPVVRRNSGGDARDYGTLMSMMREKVACLPTLKTSFCRSAKAPEVPLGCREFTAAAQICSCHDVCKSTLCGRSASRILPMCPR